MNSNVTKNIEDGISTLINKKKNMECKAAFIKLFPFQCRSRTLRNTLDIMNKKGLIVSDKVASKCVVELSNTFDELVKDLGEDQLNRSSTLLFEALLCKTITYICRLEANIKSYESRLFSIESKPPPDVAALLIENQQMKDVVSAADRQVTHLRSNRDKILKTKQEELEQVHKELNSMRKHLNQVQEEAKRDKSQYMEKEKTLQLVLTQLSSAQEEVRKLKKLTTHPKKATTDVNSSTFSVNDSKIIKAYENKKNEELRSLRIGKDILRHELHKERVNRSVDIADLINTQSQIEEYAHELEIVNQILEDENQLRLESEQKVQEYADKLDEVQHQLTMSTKIIDSPIHSPARSNSPTRLPKSPMRHHSPVRPIVVSDEKEESNLVHTLRESLKQAQREKEEIQRQCLQDTSEIQHAIGSMQDRLRALTEENHRLQDLVHQSSHSTEQHKHIEDTNSNDNNNGSNISNIHSSHHHHQNDYDYKHKNNEDKNSTNNSQDDFSVQVDELKMKLLDTTEHLIATRNENITLKANPHKEASDEATYLMQIEALKMQCHNLTESFVKLQKENNELRETCREYQVDNKLRKDLMDAENRITMLSEQLGRIPPSFHVAMAEKRVLEAKLAKAIDTGDTKLRIAEKQKEKAIHELHSVLSNELSEKEALRNAAQEQALTIHQLTLHLKLLQEASIEHEREISSRYDIDKSFSLPDFDYNSENLNTSQVSHKWGIESRRAIATNEMNRSDDLNKQALNVSVVSSSHSTDVDLNQINQHHQYNHQYNQLSQIKINEEKFRELDRLLKLM